MSSFLFSWGIPLWWADCQMECSAKPAAPNAVLWMTSSLKRLAMRSARGHVHRYLKIGVPQLWIIIMRWWISISQISTYDLEFHFDMKSIEITCVVCIMYIWYLVFPILIKFIFHVVFCTSSTIPQQCFRRLKCRSQLSPTWRTALQVLFGDVNT